MEATTAFSSRLPARRLVQAVLALAMLTALLTSLTAPAAALPGQAEETERILRDVCIGLGGDPTVPLEGEINCMLPDGHVVICKISTLKCQAFVTRGNPGNVPHLRSRGQLVPVGTTLTVLPGTHLAWSGDRIIVVADAER